MNTNATLESPHQIASTHQIAMKVNQANLLKGLRLSFTNKTTVLSELMQKARRAGATQVVFDFNETCKTLTVCDDGYGIESIETLLTVAESGWDADIINQEHPFGLGFLSALYACQHLSVLSKSGGIAVDTEAVLSLEPVMVYPVDYWDGVTRITLAGIDLDIDRLSRALCHFAQGFPIPVIFNGEVLDRPVALDSKLNFAETELGQVYVHGLDSPIGAQSEFELFLQGLPIYCSTNYKTARHIIHLDSKQCHARLPDRDKLVDECEVLIKVRALLAGEIKKRLLVLKAECSPEYFVKFFDMMRRWNVLDLLNDVPVVPPEILNEISCYPVCDTDVFDSFENRRDAPWSKAEILERGVVTLNDNISEAGAARYMLA